ncbi:ribosome biogenesis protein SPATA5L1-like isoform X1 [Argiope bruennichi]|uniref:ribosome biogenesis protein SPATA5L1-like isoform X1 n=1 Tax=Argiope bruennichi TaxID=94029 RepID=UPI002495990B|nr:ribosome biogenesis protein SPATA5L1-like isoform X1 [Argiope bruennichi]
MRLNCCKNLFGYPSDLFIRLFPYIYSGMFRIACKIRDGADAYAQKCCIPSSILKDTSIKAFDVVIVNCGIYNYICRVFPLPVTDLENCITVESIVSFSSSSEAKPWRARTRTLLFPDDISVIKTTSFEKLQVKLVFEDEAQKLVANIESYQKIILTLLQHLIIKKNSIIDCRSQIFADLYHIHSIIISETFHDAEDCGRITKSSSIEIIESDTLEQLNLLKDFVNMELGGMNTAASLLDIYLIQNKYKSVIVLGPSGSGKSTLIKSFCKKKKSFLVLIDGMKDCNLTFDKCNEYVKQLSQSSFSFPGHPTILFIDHIDELASSNTKKRKQLINLVYLLKHLEKTNILVVAAAVQKELIHPSIANFFKRQVLLGIPTFDQRKEILTVLTKSTASDKLQFDKIAGLTPGFVASDLVQLTQEALKIKTDGFNIQRDDNKCSTNPILTTEDFEKALLSVSPSVLKTSEWSMKVKPVYWKDIGGMFKIKERLQLSIEMPLRHPELFKKVDLHCPRGVLLFGPPGCCKTTLARGLATECNANFFAANPSQIYSSYVGESEKNITQLFYQARLSSPSIIFLDELDSLVGFRDFGSKQQGVAEKVLSTLLNEMDGLGAKTHFGVNLNPETFQNSDSDEENDMSSKKQSYDEVIVVAATNRPDCIDDALLRPGRFDIILYVPAPNCEERQSILETLTNGMPLKEINLKNLADKTEHYTGADLKHLCNMAAMNALRENIQNAEYITEEHFLKALEHIKPSVSKEQIQMYEQLAIKYGPIISE